MDEGLYTQLDERSRKIRIGLTEAHGMATELLETPPEGCEYSFLEPKAKSAKWLRSPIKGYFGSYSSADHEIIEAVISPIHTSQSWVYSLACFQEALAFNLLNVPLPRRLRSAYIQHLLSRPNLKHLVFWSDAGKETLKTYGGVTDPRIHAKASVVYPAIRSVPDEKCLKPRHGSLLLFSGDFFRKGGVNVVDAFEQIQTLHPDIKLQLCCDEKIDFNTSDEDLRRTYLQKIRSNPRILFGRVTRKQMMEEILPATLIYLLPTYNEAFGFAILEAMAHGIPVISTNHFAIPEMIKHGQDGFLIDTSSFDCERLFRGYVVNEIPARFREHINEHLVRYLTMLLNSPQLRHQIGNEAVNTARTKFSFEMRNRQMQRIYRQAVGMQ